MEILTIILPFSKSTSNIALSCKSVCNWVFNNGFPIRTSKGGVCFQNLFFHKTLKGPHLDVCMKNQLFGIPSYDSLILLLEAVANIKARDDMELRP